MNWCVNFSKSAVAAWLSAGLVMVLPVAAAPVAQPAAPEVVSRSVFVTHAQSVIIDNDQPMIWRAGNAF